MAEAVDVVVVGGGVIGVCSAYYLAKLGRSVILVERDEVGKGCSYANAGLITPSHAMPIAAPGVIKQACKWMLHEDSPLLFRPRLDWGLVPWLIRFAAHCREKAVNRAIPVLRDLSRASLGLFEELVSAEGLSFHFERRGLLSVYPTEQGFEKGKREASLLTRHGFQPKVLDGKQVCELGPSVREGLAGGVYYEEDAHGDCHQFVAGMSAVIQKLGVTIRTHTRATRIVPESESHVSLLTDNGEYSGRALVLATGSWTPQLAKDLRVKISLQPGKGYSVTVDRPPVSPTIPVMNAERKVIITPLGNRLRFAGTMEFAGLDLTPSQSRSDAVLRGGLGVMTPWGSLQNVERWCGLRPCTPDGLPIIDLISQSPPICISTGHAMLGYTLGPITGKLVAEAIAGRPPSMDINALRIGRF
jgi:D-amino-acid dehydrogenase